MKRMAMVVLLVAAFACRAAAQETAVRGKGAIQVRELEFEAGLGMIFAGERIGGRTGAGPTLVLALRYNHQRVPLDFGVQLAPSILLRDGDDWRMRTFTLPFQVQMHYNFRRGRKVSPFIGIEAGMAHGYTNFDFVDIDPYDDNMFYAGPRAGVEFFNHLRLTVRYAVGRSYASNLGIVVSYAFGGGPKKGAK